MANKALFEEYLKGNYLACRERTFEERGHNTEVFTIEQLNFLMEMARNDVYPDIRFGDNECNVWCLFHRFVGS